MWMNLFYFQGFSNFSQTRFYTTNLYSLMWCSQCYKKSRIIICSTIYVILQMNLSPRIKINHSFFITFTEYNTFTLIEIDIGLIQQYHFSNS